MYKDKDKQREAAKERQRRYKAKQKALPKQGVTPEKELLSEGVTDKALPHRAISIMPGILTAITKPKRGKDIKCFEDLPPDVQQSIDRISETEHEHNKGAVCTGILNQGPIAIKGRRPKEKGAGL